MATTFGMTIYPKPKINSYKCDVDFNQDSYDVLYQLEVVFFFLLIFYLVIGVHLHQNKSSLRGIRYQEKHPIRISSSNKKGNSETKVFFV